MIHSLNYQVASHFSKAKESPRIVMNSRESKPAINENNSGGMVTSMSTNYPMMGRRIEYNQSDMILDFKRFPQNQQKKFPLVVETVDTRANKQLTSSQSLKTIPDNPAKIINSNNTPNQYQQLQQQQQQLQYLSQFHSLQQQQQQTVSSRNPKQTYEAPSRSRVDMLPLNQQSHQNYLSPSSASSAQSTVKNVHKRNILLSNVSSNSSAYKTIAVSPGVAQASSPGVLSPGKKSITPRKKSNPSKKREKTEESSAYQLKPVSKSGSQHSQSNNNNIYANQVPVKNLSQPSQKGSRQGSNSNIYGNHSLKQQHHRQQETNMLLVSSPHLSSAMKSPFHSNKTTSAKQNKTNNNPQTNTNKWKRQQSKRSKTPEGKGDQARSNRQEVNNNRERENYPEQQVSSQQQQQSSELVSSQQDPLRGSSQYSSPQASSRNHTNARNSQKENIPAGAIFPHSSGTAELNDHSKLPPNHSNNVSSNKSPSNSAPDERMLRLKALVEENVRKSLAEKQRKLEEAKIIEEHKKEKQEMIQAKNAEIRNLNAYRFSKTNKFSSHADLSRRLPWGINQEKLRNYAIQVLTKFKNQEKRQLMESLMQQKPISEMMSSFKAEEKQRRHQIGLDHLTDEEISRLVSASKLKMSMQNLSQQELLELHHQQQQQQHHYYSQQQQPNEAISSSDYPPEPMTERTKQKEEERKREELASYMEEKKHRMEQAELSKKLEKLLVEEKVKENQQILNNNIRSIFQRLKKRKHHHQSHQRHHTQTDRNNRSSPQQQYPLMTTGNSRHHTQPSYQQIPTAQNSTSKVPTQVYTQQRLTEPSQAEFIPQLRGVAVVKTEENNNNNNSNRLGISSSQNGMVRSNYISGTMPTLPSQSQGQQSQLYGGAVLATQPEYDGEMIQDENDYSALYEEFKQLIVSPNEKNQQVQIVQPALGYSQLAGGSSAAAMGRQNYLLTQESQYGQNNNISQQQQQLYLQQQQQLQQQAYAVYLQQQHSPLMERAVTSSSALRGSQYSVSGKKRNRTPINAGVAASKPSKHHGKIRRVKTSEGGKRTKKAKREEQIGQNIREGNNNNHQGGGLRRIMMIDEMGNTEDIEGGQQAVENASDREINNQLVAAKLKFDELARRLIQIKLNNSKNDSLNTNNLTKIPRQFLSNGQIEEKIESEDFDSSRKEFDNGSYVLHPSNNQIHNKNNNNNGNSEGESLLEAGQQLGILQDEHGHVAQKRIGMGNNNNSNTGDVQLLQQQQDKQNQLQQQQQKQYQMQQQQQQQHLQKDSSSSAILKVAEEEDVEKDDDDDDDDHSMNHHNNNLLESNLFENNEALYNQLEMQRNDPEEQERREEEQHSQPSNNSRRFAKRQGASQTPSKDEGHIDEHFDANGTHPDADDNHENYFVYENQQGKALQQAQQKQQLQQQQLQYQQQQLQQQQQQQGHYDGHGQEEDEEEDIGEFHSKDHGDDDDHHHDDVEHIHAGEGNHEQQWDYYDDMSEEQLQEMAQQIFVNSAVFIQKIWRGYFTRKILFYYLEILEKGEMDKFQAQGSEEEQHNQQGNKAIYEGHIYQDDNNHEEHEHQQGQEEEGEYMHNIHGDAGDNVNNHLQEYEGEEEENDGEYHFDGFQGSSLKDDDDAAAAGNGGGGLNSLNLKVQEDKFVHISTIKSSIVSNDDNIHSKIIIDGNNAQEKQLSAMIPNMQQGIKTNKMQSVNANAGAGGQEQDQRTAGQLLNQQLEHSEIFQQQQGLDGQQHEREEGIEGGEHEYDDDHQEGEDEEEGHFGQEFPQEQQQAGADIHRMEELNSEEENQQQEEQDQQHHQYPDHDGDEHYAHHHHHHDPNGAEPDDDEYDEHQQQQQQQQYYSVAGMTEDSLINWKHVQQQVNYLAQSGHPEAKNQIIEVLQELSLSNRERLLQCIEDNDQDPEDSQNFSIEQIEAVFRIPFEQGMTGDEEEEEEDEGEKDPNQEGYAQGEDEQRHHEGSEGVTEEQQLEQDKKNHHHLQDHLNDQENSDKPTDVYERPEINYDNHGYSDLKGRVLLNEVRISSDRITVGSPDVQFGSPIPQQSQQNHQQGLAGQSSLQNQQMFSPLAGGTTTASNAATPSQALQILRTPIKDPTQDPPRKQRANGQLQIDLAIVEGEGHDDGKNVNDIDQMKNKGIHDDNVNQNAQGSEGKDIIKDSTQQVQISHPAEVPADGDDDQGHPTLGDATTSKQQASSSNPFSQKTPYNFLKSSDRQSNSSKGSSSKRAGGKTHSFTYEAQSERSFNQMRRNKFHSPKDLRLSHRNSGLTYQSDECQSLDPVSPKEELTQLYALLQQEQLLSNKKDKISRGSRNINTELQQEIVGKHAEYFELGNSRKEMNNSSTGKIKGGIAGVSAGQDEGLTNRSQPEKTMNASTSSIFDHDSFQAFNEKKIKQIMSTQNINEILSLREKALTMRHKSQMNAMDQMLSQKHVSPRTYDSKKQELENWVQNEKEEISQTRKELERGLMKAMESIQKTQRDVQLAQRFKTNPSRLDSRSSFASEEEYLFRRKMENEAASSKSDSDNQSDNLSSSQALKHLLKEMGTPTDKNNIKIIDQFELKDHHREDDAKNKDNNNNEVQDADGDNSRSKSKNQGNTNVLVLPKQQSQLAKMKMKKEPKKYADGDNEDEEEEEDEDIQHREQIGQGNNSNINNNRFKDDRAKSEDSLGTNQDFQSESQEKKRDSSFDDEIAASPTQEKKIIAASADGNNSNNAVSNAAPAEGNKKLSSNKVKLVLDYNDLEHNSNSSQVDQSKKPQQEGQDSNLADPQVSSGVSNAIDNAAAQQNDKLGSDKSSQEAMTNSQKESISDQDDIDQLKFNEDSELAQERQHAFNQLSSPSAEFMERSEILAEMQDKWRTYNQIDARIQEQLQKLFSQDKSDNYGIATNLKIVTDYIQTLFNYVVDHYKQDFLDNLNTPFGFAPSKRLKLIHGYDSFVDSSCSEEGSTDDYNTLPFVLSEELFIEFEQNIIGNGETEKEQIIKEFEHIHNKAIFDTFNEALNIFRPFYTLGGPPYSWTKSEKNLVLGKASQKNLGFILEKSKARVMEWSSYLCGLVNEDEQPRQLPLEDEKGNPPPLSVLLENLTPQNEYLAQVREEKLSKMLLTEIFENEYKWQLYEDEKTEVVMELADLVFEQLVEEVVHDMSPRRNGRDAGEEEDQEGEIDGDFHGHEKEEGEEEQFGLDEFSQENLQQHDVHEDQEQHQE